MRPPRPSLFSLPPTLAVLFIVNVAVELLLLAADHGVLGSPLWRADAYANGAFWGGLLDNWRPNFPGQPAVMFLSYAFLHAGWQHLLGNMVMLVLLGRAVVARCGEGGFLAIYFFACIGGGVGFALLGSSPRPMVGASGALFGLLGALLAWEALRFRAAGRVPWPVWRDIAGLAVLNLVFWIILDGMLAWETHLGGFLAGGAVALVGSGRCRTGN